MTYSGQSHRCRATQSDPVYCPLWVGQWRPNQVSNSGRVPQIGVQILFENLFSYENSEYFPDLIEQAVFRSETATCQFFIIFLKMNLFND